MRTALRVKNPRGNVSSIYQVNAPVVGWVVTGNLAAMPKDSAYVLDNWFPEQSSIRVRQGNVEYATLADSAIDIVNPIGTLMVHNAGGTIQSFAAVDSFIFNFTGGGAITAADVTGLTSDRWIWTNFATAGGNFLYAVDGVDDPEIYDGAAWSNPVITMATPADFSYVFPYRGRLFFLNKNSSTVNYLPPDSIEGAAGTLEVGAELTLGGTLVAGGNLTQDAGFGPDDYAVFVSSEGEVVIYIGTDPGDPAEWSKVGTYRIGRPIGSNCLLKIGGDLAVLCQDGVVSLTRSILLDRAAAQNGAFTGNIAPAFANQYQLTGTVYGWQILTWPIGHMAIVNVPITEGSTYEQYVMNVLNGSWCRYTDINATYWTLSGDNLYWGTLDGRVMQHGTVGSDEGEAINAKAIPAWSAMGQNGKIKHVKEAQVFLRASGTFTIGMNIAADFQSVQTAVVTANFQIDGGPLWDVALWDVDLWGQAIPDVRPVWLGVAAEGYFLAPVLFAQIGDMTTTGPISVEFYSMNLVYESGAILG